MRLLFTFLLLLSLNSAMAAQSEPLVTINSDTTNLTQFKIGLFLNNTDKLDFPAIQSQQFVESNNADTLGITVTDTWVKMNLFNATDKQQSLVLHQDLGYTFIDMQYFLVNKQGELIDQQQVNPALESDMHGADALYAFTLEPQEYRTIFVRQKTDAYHFYNFSIRSDKNAQEFLIAEKIDSIFFVGLLLALAIYNLLLFVSSRSKEYLYYSLYLLTAMTWMFYMYGSLAHYIHLYGGIAFRFNFALMIIPIFLALFVQSIFETKAKYPTEHKFLTSIIVLLTLNVLYGIVDFNSALQLLSLLLDYTLIVFLWVSISLYRKGNKLVKIFLVAHIFYIIFNIYALLFYMGLVDYSYIALHGIGVGIVIEALVLSYLLSYKFKILQDERRQAQGEANTDGLTRLYNKRKYEADYEDYYTHSDDIALAFIDGDHFKSVNDSYGHDMGDQVLIQMANVLFDKTRILKNVHCYRYGGEEFIVLFMGYTQEEVMETLNQIKASIETIAFQFEGKPFTQTISIGVAFKNNQPQADPKALFNAADAAVYEAKAQGRNRIVISEGLNRKPCLNLNN